MGIRYAEKLKQSLIYLRAYLIKFIYNCIRKFEKPMLTSQKILCCLCLTVVLTAGCSTTYTKQELATVDKALETGNAEHLRGKLSYLYRKKQRKLRVDQAALKRDPSDLDRLELVMYKREIRRLERVAEKEELTRLRQADQKRKEEQRLAEEKRIEAERLAEEKRIEAERLAEEQRLAEIAAEEEKQRLAEEAREQRRIEREQEKQRKIAAAEQKKRKMAEPLHADWKTDMQDLTVFLKEKDFEPAHRLVDVYARTMQFLVHIKPDAEEFSDFYATLTDSEQIDHRRLFQDGTGQELLTEFWSSHERAGRVPSLGN